MITATQILRQIKDDLVSKKDFLHLRGNFHLTKSHANFSDVLLQRDFDLEQRTLSYIENKSQIQQLLRRYKKYDPELNLSDLPPHYAMKVVSGAGSICSGDNIFMFFPTVLGLPPKSRDDSFGFEFIDIWKNIFQQSIFPCVKEIFALESQVQIHITLAREIEQTIYLAAIFHELGHEVGPWRVSPETRPEMKLKGYELDVLGELSTDSLMILHLNDYPEIALFVILQRLFWFTRRGFKENPMHGKLNTDNDAWIGLYLWNKMKEYQVLAIGSDDRLHHNPHFIQPCFQNIVNEIDALYRPDLNERQQKEIVKQWQNDSISNEKLDNKFCFPQDLQNILGRCQNIIEIPQFMPAFGYHQINYIKEMCS